MPSASFRIYEVPGSYVSSGGTVSILSTHILSVTDNDTLMHATEAADPNPSSPTNSQIFTSFTLGPITSYTFLYNDTITVNGVTETVKTFQLVIGGTTRSFIMNDAGWDIPGLDPGEQITLQTFVTYTNVAYSAFPCFVSGTLIATVAGRRAVESIRPGDLVLTADHGPQQVRWAGKAVLTGRDLMARPQMRPVLIPAGSLGRGLPLRDLRLSRQHRVLLTGMGVELCTGLAEAFSPACHLLSLPGVRVEASPGVTYHHLLFDRHEVIFAEGLPVESLLPADQVMGDPEAAHAAEIRALFPELDAAPMVAARPVLSAREAAVASLMAA